MGGVFDTTSSNTGVREGAMVYLERILDKKLLWLACRHHIAELHIKHAYTKIMFQTNSPEDPLFKYFKEWFMSARADPEFPDTNTFRRYDWGEGDEGVPCGPYIQRRKLVPQTDIGLAPVSSP